MLCAALGTTIGSAIGLQFRIAADIAEKFLGLFSPCRIKIGKLNFATCSQPVAGAKPICAAVPRLSNNRSRCARVRVAQAPGALSRVDKDLRSKFNISACKIFTKRIDAILGHLRQPLGFRCVGQHQLKSDRVSQDQRLDYLRMSFSHIHDNPASSRMAEQMHRSKVQLLDQRRNVIGMLLKGKVVAGAIPLFWIVVTQANRDNMKALGECWNECIPIL